MDTFQAADISMDDDSDFDDINSDSDEEIFRCVFSFLG